MFKSIKKNNLVDSEDGFTVVELLVSLGILSLLLLTTSTVVGTSATINSKANLNALAGEAAFEKAQEYINTSFDNITMGTVGNSYEVEDFSDDDSLSMLSNPSAKALVKPESVVDSGTTTSTNDFSESSTANTTYSSGSEISVSGTYDPTNCCRRDYRLTDNNYYNLVYNNYDTGSSNQELPAIDLGFPQSVTTIRINWYSAYYTSQNFRIEASNNGSSWTTVSSGLSTTVYVGNGTGNYPEDYAVNGMYRYWRMFNIAGTNSTWIAISEMEAYSAATGDVVEQHGSDASSGPGNLDFSNSTLTMSENGAAGHQSVGLKFNNIDVAQGTTITNAYIQFTAASDNSAAVELLATGIDTDNATGWNGTYAVDNAVSGSGTGANSSWNPSAWSNGDSGSAQRLDVTSIVQEILNRSGWNEGNSLGIAIQYVSGSGVRIANKTVEPVITIEWSVTTTTTTGGTYVDENGDGDADNPTLLKVTTIVEYDSFGERRKVEYSTFIRKYGLGG